MHAVFPPILFAPSSASNMVLPRLVLSAVDDLLKGSVSDRLEESRTHDDENLVLLKHTMMASLSMYSSPNQGRIERTRRSERLSAELR